jgi:hypothetical protein
LRSYFADAKAYTEVKGRVANTGGGRKVNQAMEAMVPVMRGEIPIIFDVTTIDQIRGVLALADTFGVKVVLRGAREAWRLADTLAMRKIPVIVGPTTSVPGAEDPYDMTYANPGVLARAGVKIANVMVTTGDPMDVRSVVRHLFIRGQEVPLDDRHTRLYEQFRARPRTQR